MPGDNIWFIAYVIDPMTGLLNPYTRNLYIELYNEKGKLIGHKILWVNKGIAGNMMKIDLAESPGKYVFRAYTNWMKNFYPAEEFDRPLEIIGKSQDKPVKTELKYDVQFFAESGTLLAGTFNKIAIKALNSNGGPSALQGIIMDQKNDSIALFNLNKMGTGEIILSPEKNSIYRAKVILPDGKEEIVNLPPVESKGVIASLNTYQNNKIIIEIKSNPETVGKEKFLYAMMHNNGNVFQIFNIRLTSEKTSLAFSLDRSKAGNGVNYLTVFNEDFRPVCERLFYNSNKDIKGRLTFKTYRTNDTVQFELKIPEDSLKHQFSNLSISVLPKGTASNHFGNSLMAEVLIKSGIKGILENSNYYLEKFDPEHLIAVDLLMLTQGWRKYNWDKITNNGNNNLESELPFTFERGFCIEGKVKSWLNGKEARSGNVSIFSPVNKVFTVGKVDSTGSYSFPNLFLLDSSRVIVSAASSKGKGWNRTISALVNPSYSPDSIIKIKQYDPGLEISEEKSETPLKLLPGVVRLPEFVITAERKKPFENNIYSSLMDKTVEITKDKLHYNDLESFFRFEFNINLERTPDGSYTVNMGRAGTNSQPKLIIDEMEVSDWSVLSSYTINEIEAVSVNKMGNAMLGDGGGIIIKTRAVPLFDGEATSTNLKNFLVKGYAPAVQYYTPKYLQSPETENYQKYASIFWKPDIVIDSTGITSLKFFVPKEISDLNVRIEGISDKGTVYLEDREISIDNQ
jgi:hypothetical protein